MIISPPFRHEGASVPDIASVVYGLCEDLALADEAARYEAILTLGSLADEANFEDAGAISDAVRSSNAVLLISQAATGSEALSNGSARIQEASLDVLCNLCADSLNPRAADMRSDLRRCDSDDRLQQLVHSEFPSVLERACSLWQTLCSTLEWAEAAENLGLFAEFERLLLSHVGEPVAGYCTDCLLNAQAVLVGVGRVGPTLGEAAQHAVEARKHEVAIKHFQVQHAMRKIAREVARMRQVSRAGPLAAPQSAVEGLLMSHSASLSLEADFEFQPQANGCAEAAPIQEIAVAVSTAEESTGIEDTAAGEEVAVEEEAAAGEEVAAGDPSPALASTELDTDPVGASLVPLAAVAATPGAAATPAAATAAAATTMQTPVAAMADAPVWIRHAGVWTQLQLRSRDLIELMTHWDEEGSGQMNQRDFRQALRLLEFNCARVAADEIFNALDEDSSGTLEYTEISRMLRQGTGGHLADQHEKHNLGATADAQRKQKRQQRLHERKSQVSRVGGGAFARQLDDATEQARRDAAARAKAAREQQKSMLVEHSKRMRELRNVPAATSAALRSLDPAVEQARRDAAERRRTVHAEEKSKNVEHRKKLLCIKKKASASPSTGSAPPKPLRKSRASEDVPAAPQLPIPPLHLQ